MHLYYTNCADGNPLITFEWSKEAVDNTVSQISETIRKIESKDFKGNAKNSYVCKFCDMRYLCRKMYDIDKIKQLLIVKNIEVINYGNMCCMWKRK